MSAQDIVERIASATGVDAATIRGASRKRAHVRARHATALALHRAGLSYSAIGRALGGQDHSSAIHACKRAAALEASDLVFAAVVAGRICPSCQRPATRVTSAPLLWCCGVGASHAYHHERGACIVLGRWSTRGDADEGHA